MDESLPFKLSNQRERAFPFSFFDESIGQQEGPDRFDGGHQAGIVPKLDSPLRYGDSFSLRNLGISCVQAD